MKLVYSLLGRGIVVQTILLANTSDFFRKNEIEYIDYNDICILVRIGWFHDAGTIDHNFQDPHIVIEVTPSIGPRAMRVGSNAASKCCALSASDHPRLKHWEHWCTALY